MTDTPKDGGAAFPTGLTPGHYSQEGMTLRDWFAGQALANNYTHDADKPEKSASWAYAIADAMIAERAK